MNREVRKEECRFDGTVRSIGKIYDTYGRLYKESLPFTGNTASSWNTYAYDNYDRILSYTESSGRETTYSYDKNSVTVVSDRVSTTRTYDALGNLLIIWQQMDNRILSWLPAILLLLLVTTNIEGRRAWLIPVWGQQRMSMMMQET